MKNRIEIWVLIILLPTCVITGCIKETAYEQYKTLEEKELASGKTEDSLFLGIRLGMTGEEFYKHCWEMNRKGLFTDGEGNTAVSYSLNNKELRDIASMNFYPSFYQDKIYRVGAVYQYDGWAPWNKHLFSDSLQQDIVRLYKTWFPGGNAFIKLEDEERGTIYVKVDGDRRIIIGKFNDERVKVDFTSLRVEEEIKKQNGAK